jgi:Protein of unknown function (DUF1569)
MNTLARDRDAQELVRRLRTLRPDSVRRWGKMSAHQMVCHLNDAFRMATGERAVSRIPTLLERTFIKWIAFHVPLRWPPGIATVPEIDQLIGGTCPTEFGADLAELETLVVSVAARRGVSWPNHPIFGRMSEAQWLRWGYLHTDHHLRQFGV